MQAERSLSGQSLHQDLGNGVRIWQSSGSFDELSESCPDERHQKLRVSAGEKKTTFHRKFLSLYSSLYIVHLSINLLSVCLHRCSHLLSRS